MDSDIIILFFTILVGIITVYSFVQKYYVEPAKKRNYAISKIKSAKRLNREYLLELRSFVKKWNCGSEHFIQGFSFDACVELFEKYDDDLYSKNKIKSLDYSKGYNESLEDLKNLSNEHIRHIGECRTLLNLMESKFKDKA